MLKPSLHEEVLPRICTLYVRVIALCFIAFAIQYWLMIVGIFDGEIYKFDTMPEHWRLAAGVLAVLYPVTALGLWGLFSWGIVLWIVALAIEVAMYTIFPNLFGEADWLVIFHLSAIGLYVLFRLTVFVLTKRFEKVSEQAN